MARESFADAEVAEVLNRDYICIKVDREERPDVDAVYMHVCQALTGSGGWPLTILMTAGQKPFFAGTYFRKHPRYGQPGLIELLEQMAKLWREDREKLLKAGSQITDFVRNTEHAAAKIPEKALLFRAVSIFERQYDETWGGFGKAPKFPSPHNLMFLLRDAKVRGNQKALAMAEHTLGAMIRGGIFDQIGGGFSRYSTDRKWLVPHFEKMLYDNALLSIVCTEMWQITKKPLFRDAAVRTLDYILRELTDREGGFYCGQDADSDGVEGKYYLFDRAEIIRILGEKDGELFCRTYDISENGNFEGKSIPNRIIDRQTGWELSEAQREDLYQYRKKRTKLHTDDKVILSWNAWTIAALARASRVLDQTKYLEAARRAQQFICRCMTDEKERLFLRWREGEAAFFGTLDEYAVYGLALLELYEAAGEPAYLTQACLRAKQITEYFADNEAGGYFLTAKDAQELIARPKEVYDGAIPSGNSVAAVFFHRLQKYTGDVFWQTVSEKQNQFLAGAIGQYPFGYSFGLIALLEALYPSRELICVTAQPRMPEEVTAFCRGHFVPNLYILLKTPGNADALAEAVPFTGDYPLPEEGTVYYLCENGSCRAPVNDFSECAAYLTESF